MEKYRENYDKRSLTLNKLKCIAIVAMFINHLNYIMWDDGSFMFEISSAVGKITAPIMFYALVEGYHKTRNKMNYAIRLLLFAIISYFPFIYARSGGDLGKIEFARLNVIFNIFIGFVAIHSRRNIKSIVLRVLFIMVLCVLSEFTDWGALGILIVVIFNYYYGNKNNQLFGYFLLVICYNSIFNYFIVPFQEWIIFHKKIDFKFELFWLSDFFSLIPILLLSYYDGKKGGSSRKIKYFFYIFYPAHLFLIGLIGMILNSGA